jgi:hypothetical protein
MLRFLERSRPVRRHRLGDDDDAPIKVHRRGEALRNEDRCRCAAGGRTSHQARHACFGKDQRRRQHIVLTEHLAQQRARVVGTVPAGLRPYPGEQLRRDVVTLHVFLAGPTEVAECERHLPGVDLLA